MKMDVATIIEGVDGSRVKHCEDAALDSAFFVESGEAEPGGRSHRRYQLPGLTGVLAIRRVNPFWYEPFMGASLEVIPEDSEGGFLEFREGQARTLGEIHFLLWRREDGKHGLAIPLSNGDRRSYLRRAGNALEEDVCYDRDATGSRVSLFVGLGDDPYQLVEHAARLISREIPGFRVRAEKRLPQFVDCFGWCTWDAFYKEVSAEKVERGLQAFAEGGVELGFLMIDDGWQQLEGLRFKEFDTDKAKFPDGLKPVVRLAKEKYGVGMVGVWHALQGYWEGVVTGGSMAERFEVLEQKPSSEFFEAWGGQFAPESRGFIHPDDIYRWYQEFYDYLSSEGVDMVKVDNQGMLEFFTEGSPVGNVSSMKAYQQALQGASQTHFEGNLINCMSNTNDVSFNLSASAIWRNSDDFYPNKPASKQAGHVVVNAFNNLWTSAFVWGDWDMFQTTHKHAEFHAMARAISGGPVYVSDKVGAHDFEIIRKLSLADGKILRFADPAQPSADGLFADPRVEKTLLKICNHNLGIGTVALFNCHSDEEEEEGVTSSGSVSGNLSAGEMYMNDGYEYVCYAHKRGLLGIVTDIESLPVSLGPMESEIVTISPVEKGVALIGLKDKYASSAGIEMYEWLSEDRLRVALKGGGRLLFFSKRKPAKARSDGSELDYKWERSTSLVEVTVTKKGPSVVELSY